MTGASVLLQEYIQNADQSVCDMFSTHDKHCNRRMNLRTLSCLGLANTISYQCMSALHLMLKYAFTGSATPRSSGSGS